MGANFNQVPQEVFEGGRVAPGVIRASTAQAPGLNPQSRTLEGRSSPSSGEPSRPSPSTQFKNPSNASTLHHSESFGEASSLSLPQASQERFSDLGSFLRATGHEVIKLKERALAGAMYSDLSGAVPDDRGIRRGSAAAVWTLFERAYDACEKVFCDENEGLSKARVFERLLDEASTWDFILVAHPETLTIAAGYVIHTGEFDGTAFSIAEYVWVDPEFRRVGLGACFVDFMMQELRTQGVDIHFGEIKDPCLDTLTKGSSSGVPGVGVDPKQQFAFWKKQGRLLVDTMWPQPALLPGDQESLSEQLTALPLGSSCAEVSPRLLLAVWDAKYGADTWEPRTVEELGILKTRAKLEQWLKPFCEEQINVPLIPLDQTRQWTQEQCGFGEN